MVIVYMVPPISMVMTSVPSNVWPFGMVGRSTVGGILFEKDMVTPGGVKIEASISQNLLQLKCSLDSGEMIMTCFIVQDY